MFGKLVEKFEGKNSTDVLKNFPTRTYESIFHGGKAETKHSRFRVSGAPTKYR